jgi:hypothetical protein
LYGLSLKNTREEQHTYKERDNVEVNVMDARCVNMYNDKEVMTELET